MSCPKCEPAKSKRRFWVVLAIVAAVMIYALVMEAQKSRAPGSLPSQANASAQDTAG